MNKIRFVAFALLILFTFKSYGKQSSLSQVWPGKKGFPRKLIAKKTLSQSDCKKFDELTKGKDLFKTGIHGLQFSTDQVMVLKNGHVIYEWSDLPNMRLEDRHPWWSVSKAVTATLLGAAIQQEFKTPSGKKISLETKVSEFYPFQVRKEWLGSISSTEEEWYNQLTLNHLMEMASGLEWEENYEADIRSTVVQMLFGKGLKNIPQFSLSVPMLRTPGIHFNYSGGNSNIIMGVLSKLWGKQSSLGPKKILFDKLGVTSAFYEVDMSGNFLASSHLQAKPEDLLRIGYLFTNKGVWQGRQILPVGWVDRAAKPASVLNAPGHKNSYRYIRKVGTFGAAGLWINKEVSGTWIKKKNGTIKVKNKIPQFFPDLPENLMFMAGHYGQILLIFPSENLIIARTGNDKEYWSKLNEYGSYALKCFAN